MTLKNVSQQQLKEIHVNKVTSNEAITSTGRRYKIAI